MTIPRSTGARPRRTRALAALAAAATVVAGLTAVAPPASAATTVTVPVDFGTTAGPLSHRGDGFLHGLSPARPDSAIIDQVGVRALRAAPLYLDGDRIVFERNGNPAMLEPTTWQRTRSLQADLIGNLAYNTGNVPGKTGSYFPGDGGDWSTWTGIIDRLVTESESRGFTGAYSVWNEPDAEFVNHGSSYEDFLTAYEYAHHEITSIDPTAKIVGPEIHAYDFGQLTQFLTFAQANDVLPDVLDWHELVEDPSVIAEHVSTMTAWMEQNLEDGALPIAITEYGNYGNFTRPGNNAAFLAAFESVGIAFATKANWPRPNGAYPTSGDLPSLVTADGGSLTAVGQVYKAYNEMSGVRVASPSPDAQLPVLAAKDTARNRAWALVAHADAALGTQSFQLQLSSIPAGLVQNGRTRVSVQVLADDYGTDANDPNTRASAPVTVSDADVTVTGGAAQVALTLDRNDAAIVRLLPPLGTSAPSLVPTTLVDDASPALAYGTGWTAARDDAARSATEHTSSNGTVEFSFTGSELRLLTETGPDNGRYRVYIDDFSAPAATVDTYSAQEARQQQTYRATGLEPGGHRVRLVATGEKSAASTAATVAIDAIEYTPANRVTVDDAASAIAYSSGWTAGTDATFSSGTKHSAGAAGARADLSFIGSALTVWTKRGPDNGRYRVYIDDLTTPVATVDAYSAAVTAPQVAFRSTGLAPGPHTVRIEVTGQKSSASSGPFVGLDRLEYTPSTPTVVDDAASAISYGGSWTAGSDPAFVSLTKHSTGVAGSSASLSFTGGLLRIRTRTGPDNGRYQVFLDGATTPVATVDAYSPYPRFQQVTFESTALAYGPHTVRIVVTGQKNASSSAAFIGLDTIEFTS